MKKTNSLKGASGRSGQSSLRGSGQGLGGGKKIVIKSLKAAPSLPSNFEENNWSKLKEAVVAIHEERAIDHSLEELYKAVEELCSHKLASSLYNKLCALLKEHVQSQADRLESLTKNQSNIQFLKSLNVAWNEHNQHMSLIRSIFIFLDRTFVLQTANSLSLNDVSLAYFRELILRHAPILDQFRSAVHAVLLAERRKEQVDRELLLQSIQMCSTLSVYEEFLEADLLEECRAFYAKESASMLSSLDTANYLRLAEEKLREERELGLQFFESRTLSRLAATVDETLLKAHLPTLLAKGFAQLLQNWRVDDLARLYRLASRKNVSALGHLKAAWAEETEQLGRTLLESGASVGGGAAPATGGAPEMSASALVNALLSLKLNLDTLLERAFHNNRDFANALKDSSNAFVNLQTNKIAQLLAKHVNALLSSGANKRLSALSPSLHENFHNSSVAAAPSSSSSASSFSASSSSPDSVEWVLRQCMSIFRLLNGKDVFEAFFSKDLSKRLLLGKSESHDTEQTMLRMLKEECGAQFTAKLEGMFKDIALADELMAKFQEHESFGKLDIDLKVTVLTQSFWPPYPNAACKLPAVLLSAQEIFSDYYKTAHSGRQLTFQNALGHCVLKAQFSKQKELNVSQFQALVLLAFNDPDALASGLSVNSLEETTGLDKGTLTRTLASLSSAKVKILLRKAGGGDDDASASASTLYMFNNDFRHKLYRIKINAIQIKETPEEEQKVKDKVFKDRQFQVDAAIVRIMKMRKTLKHEQLIAELLTQLRFPAQPSDLKKRIESLIEREYLERRADDRTIYNYLA